MNQEESSFTLIELLVVIAIVGILAGILIVSMTGATNNANDARRKADINQIVKELLIYNTSNPAYPIETCSIGSNCSTALNTILGNAVNMKDPKGTFYTYSSTDGISFTVSATLSNSNTYTYNSASSKYASNAGSSCISGGGLTCTETINGAYTINKYTLSGTTTGTFNWVVPIGVTQAEVLVVAGGGAGGNYYGGGGGAGGLVYTSNKSVTPGSSIEVVVGAGGLGVTGPGGIGENSKFSDIIALGGGGGGYSNNAYATEGGSGGGGGGYGYITGGAASQPTSSSGGYGNAGGAGGSGVKSSGGGGGAGSAGSAGSGSVSGAGGSGKAYSITGTSLYYAAGGGGGSEGGTAGLGGSSIGGNGSATGVGSAGTAGTGSGGGGGRQFMDGGPGGSGVVIIKYLAP